MTLYGMVRCVEVMRGHVVATLVYLGSKRFYQLLGTDQCTSDENIGKLFVK